MSNLERDPVEVVAATAVTTDAPAPVERLLAREVPLGGPRALTVHRTLPQRGRTTIGAWCFVDHYGPDDDGPDDGARDAARGMVVPPHPHTGLQTASWLFAGDIEHRDSTGSVARVLPGELNLMTAGRGISHSEVSTPAAPGLPGAPAAAPHGVQLWLALPDAHRHQSPHFEHHLVPPVPLGDAVARVFLGALAAVTAPARAYSPVLGAQLDLPAGCVLELELEPGFEHGVLVDRGPVRLEGVTLDRTELGYVAAGRGRIRLENPSGHPARVLLLGGEPFGEQLVMWWNFIGRSHEEIVAWRTAWQSEVVAGADAAGRFGTVAGYPGPPLPAPALPTVRLKPRG